MSGVGITFDETHSFRDWGLRLKKIAIGIPKAKTEYVSVPGMNGDLDLSEAQNGGVNSHSGQETVVMKDGAVC